ncbi:Glyoxylase, beta-lactamase superfamily II [Psychrobacillus sp. OK028]|uniref:MBL fold metallo-hydrolase n=1 Tax=Psychrobacillus sp. OK028 TaxID=1884359 RepID=UPI00088C4DDF|nr:MBL fold metallo-hydrolase [Psychrobacillus sp. OK028]SDN32799.1 Glyoxylase, beta-lactamase superfamily II [Psychrobacillus sp. OK028]
MGNSYPKKLNERIYLIDGFDMGETERTGTYVIDEEYLTIVETGPSPSVKYVKSGLEALGFSLDQLKYIIVTHIHLDHAGGAGLLLEECPNAQVVVHPKGARHLAEPERLRAGAKAVYGTKFEEFFDPIIPIPTERMIIKNDGDLLKIGETCILKFFDTPGHANHHFSIYDPISNGVFTGDTVGVRYEQLAADGVNFFLPSTSPNQFNPAAMQKAIVLFASMDLQYIYYGHFGMTDTPEEALSQVSMWLNIFISEAEAVFSEEKGHEELATRLGKLVKEHLRNQGIPENHHVFRLIQLDLAVSAMGLMDYLIKREQE